MLPNLLENAPEISFQVAAGLSKLVLLNEPKFSL
jgi:hypothetical protein